MVLHTSYVRYLVLHLNIFRSTWQHFQIYHFLVPRVVTAPCLASASAQ